MPVLLAAWEQAEINGQICQGTLNPTDVKRKRVMFLMVQAPWHPDLSGDGTHPAINSNPEPQTQGKGEK